LKEFLLTVGVGITTLTTGVDGIRIPLWLQRARFEGRARGVFRATRYGPEAAIE